MDVTFKLNSGPRKLLNIIQHGIEVRATQELNTASHCFEILTIMNIKMGILWCWYKLFFFPFRMRQLPKYHGNKTAQHIPSHRQWRPNILNPYPILILHSKHRDPRRSPFTWALVLRELLPLKDDLKHPGSRTLEMLRKNPVPLPKIPPGSLNRGVPKTTLPSSAFREWRATMNMRVT